MTCFLVEPIQRTFEPKRKTKFSKPIIGLVEFVYEEERIECKKISVGEVDSEKVHEGGNGYCVSFIHHL